MKVITFSRFFPVTHPKAGQETYFIEKIWDSLPGIPSAYTDRLDNERLNFIRCGNDIVWPKHHTIRAGERWRVGDWFSPRVWCGKPYASKQLEFAPSIQIKRIWTFEKNEDGKYFVDGHCEGVSLSEIAKNDGLEQQDFESWFYSAKGKPFKGQILCWNESLEYCWLEKQGTEPGNPEVAHDEV